MGLAKGHEGRPAIAGGGVGAMVKQLDKRMSAAEIVGQLKDGMALGIGGWGPRR